MNILEKMGMVGIVPVVVLERPEDAVPAARALLDGGIDVMEITLRTPAAEAAIRAVADQCPVMTVGAGTVVSAKQCGRVLDCGAQFIVSPGCREELIRFCVERGAVLIPGCATPSEIMLAVSYGLEVLKFFPANIYGGIQAMRALAGPFPRVRFIPTGGINGENLAEYAAERCIHAVGGSWLCGREDIARGRFDRIAALCRQAREPLKNARASRSQ